MHDIILRNARWVDTGSGDETVSDIAVAGGRIASLQAAGPCRRSIEAGGTTLRDFYGGDGEPGYFKQELAVYDREADVSGGVEKHLDVVAWILIEDDKGRSKPIKVGMEPVQRDGIDYEFDVMLQMDANNTAVVDKTRCSELNETVWEKPGARLAEVLNDWLSLGKPNEDGEDNQPAATAGENVGNSSVREEIEAILAEHEAEYGDAEDEQEIPFELGGKGQTEEK